MAETEAFRLKAKFLGYTAPMKLNTSYFLAMALIHLGFFLCLRNAFAALRARHSWALSVQGVCLAVLSWHLYGVYEVIPALWWPGGDAHFFEQVRNVLATALAALAAHLAFGLQKRKPPSAGKVVEVKQVS